MSLEALQISREIDGRMYIMNPLPFGIGHKALLRFTKLAGPVMASALGQNGGAAAVAAIANALSEEDLSYFANAFGNASWYVDGGKNVPLVQRNQEDHFALRYTAFFEWLAMGVELNFGPFFSDLLKKAGVVVSRQPTTVGTPSTSVARTG